MSEVDLSLMRGVGESWGSAQEPPMKSPAIVLLAVSTTLLLSQIPVPLHPHPSMVGKAAPTLPESVEDNHQGRTDGTPATTVTILDGERRIKLDSAPGTIGRTWVYFSTLFWADFPGKQSACRVMNTRPTFLISMEKTPRNRLFLVRCRVNRSDANRSVKLGQAGIFTYKGINAPDRDWVIPVSITEERPGLWRVVPEEALPPGEYGYYSGPAAAYVTKGNPAGELFEFGVDPA
jgi:hypothetical protein